MPYILKRKPAPTTSVWRRLALPFVSLLALVLMALYISQQGLGSNPKGEAEQERPSLRVNHSSAIRNQGVASPPLVSGSRSSPGTGSGGALSDSLKQTILDCTKNVQGLSGVSSINEFDTLEEYLPRATLDAPFKRQIEMRNVHVRMSSGQILRLHQAQEMTADGSGERTEIRLFSVDRENLPVPKPLPKEWSETPQNDVISAFRNSGELIFDETTESQRWSSDLAARVVRDTKNQSQIREMELFMENPGSIRALICGVQEDAGFRCRCL